MKNNKLLFFLFLTLTTAREHSNCGKYEDDWRIAQCASSLRKDNLISLTTFHDYLTLAMSKNIDKTDNFYGAGITTGHDNHLMVGKMTKPIIKQGLAIDIHPSSLYYTKKIVDLGHHFTRTVLIYPVNDIEGIPTWNTNLLSRLVPTGHETRYAVFSTEDARAIDISGPEDCSSLSKWIDDSLPHRKEGLAIIMSQKQWCPVLSEGLTEIVVASITKETIIGADGNKKEIYTAEWAKWGSGSFGNVPQEYSQVFQ